MMTSSAPADLELVYSMRALPYDLFTSAERRQ
jgi:hypothetical protein